MKPAVCVEVVNVATHRPDGRKVTYIGRRSPYGNRHVMHHEGMRDEVCDAFSEDFEWAMENDAAFQQHMRRLAATAQEQGYVLLGCHCKPRRCHGDTIAGYLRWRLQQE